MLFSIEQSYFMEISTVMDAAAALLFLILMVSQLGSPQHMNKKLRFSFLLCLLEGFVTAGVDIWINAIQGNAARHTLISVLYIHEYLFLSLFAFAKAIFIFMFLGDEKKSNRPMKHILYTMYSVMTVVNMIPPLSRWVSYVPAGEAVLEHGPGYLVFYSAMIFADICVVAAVLINSKKVGTKYTILLSALLMAPAVSFILFASNVAPMMFFVALFMIVVYIIVYQKSLYRQIDREKELAQKNFEFTDMQTKVLLSQIQPHFLYNTLTTIAYLCSKDPANAEKLTNRLSDYLRNNIAFLSDREKIPFDKELEAVDNYLAIEQYRFEDRVKVVYDIQVQHFAIPMLAVETLVENAVKHGICKREDGGTIWISTYCDDRYNYVQVRDNGVGFDVTAVPQDGKTHVGLANVTNRVLAVGGELCIESVPGAGTTATLRLPKEDDA